MCNGSQRITVAKELARAGMKFPAAFDALRRNYEAFRDLSESTVPQPGAFARVLSTAPIASIAPTTDQNPIISTRNPTISTQNPPIPTQNPPILPYF